MVESYGLLWHDMLDPQIIQEIIVETLSYEIRTKEDNDFVVHGHVNAEEDTCVRGRDHVTEDADRVTQDPGQETEDADPVMTPDLGREIGPNHVIENEDLVTDQSLDHVTEETGHVTNPGHDHVTEETDRVTNLGHDHVTEETGHVINLGLDHVTEKAGRVINHDPNRPVALNLPADHDPVANLHRVIDREAVRMIAESHEVHQVNRDPSHQRPAGTEKLVNCCFFQPITAACGNDIIFPIMS